MRTDIGLTWWKDEEGYEIERTIQDPRTFVRIGDVPLGYAITHKSNPEDWTRYSKKGADLKLVDEILRAKTKDDRLKFYKNWGYLWLTPTSYSSSRLSEIHSKEADFFKFVEKLRKAKELFTLGKAQEAAYHLSFSAHPDSPYEYSYQTFECRFDMKGSVPVLHFEAGSLANFARLSLMLIFCGGGEVRSCSNCGELFTVGPGTGSNRKRQYCPDKGACKMAYYRKEEERNFALSCAKKAKAAGDGMLAENWRKIAAGDFKSRRKVKAAECEPDGQRFETVRYILKDGTEITGQRQKQKRMGPAKSTSDGIGRST